MSAYDDFWSPLNGYLVVRVENGHPREPPDQDTFYVGTVLRGERKEGLVIGFQPSEEIALDYDGGIFLVHERQICVIERGLGLGDRQKLMRECMVNTCLDCRCGRPVVRDEYGALFHTILGEPNRRCAAEGIRRHMLWGEETAP